MRDCRKNVFISYMYTSAAVGRGEARSKYCVEFRLVPLIHLSLTILDFLDLVIRANSVGSRICRQIINLERNRDQQLIDIYLYVAVKFLFKLIFYFLCFRVW